MSSTAASSAASSAAISAVIITRNAGGHLGACLHSLAFADEILVVDSNSTDNTVALAQAAGARVLALDYEGEGAPELVVSLQAVRGLPPSARHFVGIEYAVVRSEFRRVKKAGNVSGPVLVLLGGGASAEYSARIAHIQIYETL